MKTSAEVLVGDILLFVLCVAAPVCFSETVDLTILQSTDIHGSPAVAKFLPWIAAERQKEPELLLVDCGDLCNGTFETYCDGGASMVSCLNAAKYDVWVPGNHEFRIAGGLPGAVIHSLPGHLTHGGGFCYTYDWCVR